MSWIKSTHRIDIVSIRYDDASINSTSAIFYEIHFNFSLYINEEYAVLSHMNPELYVFFK